eukprot:CAMPEP_0184487824 /NCGR_PEP_ID=MMETSP0113_2-20130426/10354_1 /TAXON_ID=91329 /ORGANISM="Norrisiella sphaerica, Strain BC52" /LENGTH=186 /DNA_ID=CAMNT_0026870235 /DNA_START=390 /DNA_END=950 /DNA_ORIENTATION=+
MERLIDFILAGVLAVSWGSTFAFSIWIVILHFYVLALRRFWFQEYDYGKSIEAVMKGDAFNTLVANSAIQLAVNVLLPVVVLAICALYDLFTQGTAFGLVGLLGVVFLLHGTYLIVVLAVATFQCQQLYNQNLEEALMQRERKRERLDLLHGKNRYDSFLLVRSRESKRSGGKQKKCNRVTLKSWK